MNQVTKDVLTSFNAVVDLLESIERFLSRLDIYARIPPTAETDELMAKIIVELLSTLALVTEKLTQRRSSQSILTLVLLYLSAHSRILKATFQREGHRGDPSEIESTHTR
jgi:hypothetical protein